MKNTKKFIVIVLVLSLAVYMIVCIKDNTSNIENINNTESTPNKDETLFDANIYNAPTKEYIAHLSSMKNKEYEVAYNENGYTEEELFEVVSPTIVSIVAECYEPLRDNNITFLSTGNIYDIDDKYVYIITCAHSLYDYKESKEVKETTEVKQVNIRFVDDTHIIVEKDSIFKSKDYVLYRIDKEQIPNQTLLILRTINIDNYFNISLNDLEEYEYFVYKYSKKQYVFGNVKGLYINTFYFDKEKSIVNSLELKNANIQSGMSGGGLFDKYGTYQGYVINDTCNTQVINELEPLLLLSNENYGK